MSPHFAANQRWERASPDMGDNPREDGQPRVEGYTGFYCVKSAVVDFILKGQQSLASCSFIKNNSHLIGCRCRRPLMPVSSSCCTGHVKFCISGQTFDRSSLCFIYLLIINVLIILLMLVTDQWRQSRQRGRDLFPLVQSADG